MSDSCVPSDSSRTPAIAGHLLTGCEGGDWAYYVGGHDLGELLQIGELEELTWEKLWMRPATPAEIEEFAEDGQDLQWIECHEAEPGSLPWIGANYV
jgi:hypothetical protein